jgi:hypothetical protein
MEGNGDIDEDGYPAHFPPQSPAGDVSPTTVSPEPTAGRELQ